MKLGLFAAWFVVSLVGPVFGSDRSRCLHDADGALTGEVRAPFTLESLAARLDHQRIRDAKGEELEIIVETPIWSIVSFQVRDKAGNKVARGWSDVENGELKGQGFFVSGDTEKSQIIETLESEYRRELVQRVPHSSDIDLEFEVDFKNRRVLRIDVSDATGRFLGKLNLQNGPGPIWVDEGAQAMGKTELIHFLETNATSLAQKVFGTSFIQRAFSKLSQARESGGRGIATAVYSKYLELVPKGTHLTLDSTNHETVRTLDRALASLMRSPGFKEMPEKQQQQMISQRLLLQVRESKWGRILVKSGWEVIGVEGTYRGGLYEIHCLKR